MLFKIFRQVFGLGESLIRLAGGGAGEFLAHQISLHPLQTGYNAVVLGGGIGPKLPHISQQSHLAALHQGQVVQGYCHRRRVGIVSVHYKGILLSLNQLAAVIGRNVGGNGLQGVLAGHVKIPGKLEGGQHVGGVVGAHQLRLQRSVFPFHLQERIGLHLDPFLAVAYGFQASLGQHFLKDGIVCVGKHHTVVLLQIIVKKALGVLDAFVTAEAFQVSLAHVGNESQVGLGHGQQGFQVLGMAGTHFHNGNLGAGTNLEDRERDANLVIEVAFRSAHAVGSAQGCLDQFLGGGFAVGAGKADHGNAQLPAVVSGQGLEGLQGIGNLDETGVIGLQILPCYSIRGALFQGLQGKAVAVKILSLEGEEKLVFLKGTGIRTDSCALQEDIVECFDFHYFPVLPNPPAPRSVASSSSTSSHSTCS